VPGNRSLYVENFHATVREHNFDKFRINAKVSFTVEN